MFRSILVPTDASESANAAVALGADLAAKYGAALTLLHVAFRGGELPDELVKQAEARFDAAFEAQGKSPSRHPKWSRAHQILDYMGEMILDEAAGAARDQGAPEVDVQLDYGATEERVRYWERHIGADLIVMGSRGYSELEGLLLGSVSHAVHHQCRCTCMTVRLAKARSQPEARGAGESASTTPPSAFSALETVLVAVDGSAHASQAVEVASDIASKYGARLVITHVAMRSAKLDTLMSAGDPEQLSEGSRKYLHEHQEQHGPAWALDFGLEATTPARQVFTEIGEQLLVQARAAAERKGITDVTTHLDRGDVASKIIARAAKEHAGLIVLGDRGLGEVKGMLVGSISNKVQHLAPCTTICVKHGVKGE